ncbi:MAG: hypothetical protein IPJ84_11120 [Bdellovibrionales bacterium]|nr:hypothetical protein [Bdellovibrionales bacterium]
MKVAMLHTAKVLSLSLVAAGVVGMTACGQQDPMADQPETVRQGIPPEADREPPSAKPVKQDALRIDASDFFTFKEGIEGEANITGRVLMPNTQFKLEIENMATEFPGAKYDPATGSFKWTPSRDSTGADYGTPKRLVARLTTLGTPVLGTTKSILIYVTRAETDPDIVSVDDLVRTYTREGEIRKFTVIVKDPDASDFDGARPKLVSVPNRRGPNDVAGLVYMQEPTTFDPNPVQDPTDKSRWIFKMILDLSAKQPDLRGRDFTRTEERFFFGLQAVSRFGRAAMKNVDVTIRTDVMKPQISWFEPIEVVAGQENTVQFSVFDPYNEGRLDVNFTTRLDQLPGAATQKCVEQSREGMLLCKISWKPVQTPGAVCKQEADGSMSCNIEFEVRNSSRVAGDFKFVKEAFMRKLKVIRVAGTPAPAPGPAPAPAPGPIPMPAPFPAVPPAPPVPPVTENVQ